MKIVDSINEQEVELPCKDITVFYFKTPQRLKLQGLKSYDFPVDYDTMLQRLAMLRNPERIITAAQNILGLRELLYSRNNTNPFIVDGIEGGKDLLSGGTVQAIAVCTVVLNPIVFGEDNAILIRHPDTLLHAKSQSALGALIVDYYASAEKIFKDKLPQIFIDTWSDHLINGMRVALKKSGLNHEKFILNFYDGGYISIHLDNKLNFSMWPEGFMDQHEKDLMALLGF